MGERGGSGGSRAAGFPFVLQSSIERFCEDPLWYAEKLIHSALGSYRFRIGDYRVVFDLEGDQIIVLRVGHRREIYRRR